VVLHEGFVRQVGSPSEVYDDPADTFVATFLGSPPMNLVDHGDVLVGFRPEHLLPRAKVEGPAVGIGVRVTAIEYLGSERILYALIDRNRFAEQKVIAKLPATYEVSVADGAAVEFAVAERNLRFFDKASEKRTEPRGLVWE
jgi:multiple sugar transport system ATP-binding protein